MQKILVVEDDKSLLESILTMLSLEGYNTLGAETGREGLAMAREHIPHLIIADIMMPDGDGYSMLRELRQRSSTATIPFIFLTARSNWEDMRRGMELGADDYIPKPFRRNDLIAAIRTQFEKQAILENDRLRALSHYLVEVQETERSRVAHELHNDIGQMLNGLKITLGMSKHLPDDAVQATLDEAQQVVETILQRLKHLSRALRPAILDTLGLLPALHQYLEQNPITFRGQVQFTHRGINRRFRPELETVIYRIVQKTLDEIGQRAPSADVKLYIWTEDNVICMEIEERANGIDLHNTLANPATVFVEMVERVALLGGQLLFEATPERHTRVFAQLPIMPDTRPAADEPSAPAPSISDQQDTQKLRIVLADTNDWMRQGLRTLIDAQRDLEVISEIAHFHTLAEVCAQRHPDVLVIDPHTPQHHAPDLVAAIKQDAPDTHILVLALHADANTIAGLFRSGATGYAIKDARAEDLLQAVRTVAAGQRYLSAPLVIDALETYLNGEPTPGQAALETLTEREIEVLQLIADGHKNTEIADKLSISTRTVETHRANIMRKLDVRTQASLIRFAIEHNLTRDTD